MVPDFELAEVEGLNVVAANDPAFKTLFGGMVVNDTGITETELGQMLREEGKEDDPEDPLIVLFHQPRSAAGYIGVDALADLVEGVGLLTTPRDDGIPDLPPGSINVGHLHDVEGPWVIWNTDGDMVTWTVVSQLGTSGGRRGEPHVQPLLDAVLDAAEDGERAAPVLQRGVRPADRVRRDRHQHRRDGHDHRPGRRRSPRREAGSPRRGRRPPGSRTEVARRRTITPVADTRDPRAGHQVLPFGRRGRDRVRRPRVRPAAADRRVLAEPPAVRLAEPGLAALPRRAREDRDRHPLRRARPRPLRPRRHRPQPGDAGRGPGGGGRPRGPRPLRHVRDGAGRPDLGRVRRPAPRPAEPADHLRQLRRRDAERDAGGDRAGRGLPGPDQGGLGAPDAGVPAGVHLADDP